MKFKLIYPKWEKLEGQTTFNLPPHGPIVMAATLPEWVDVEFIDENVDSLTFDDDPDFVGVSMMLTSQVSRGWQIAEEYRKRGKKVIFGGISTMLHAEETAEHADSVFLGESEGHMDEVFNDFRNGKLKPLYNFMHKFPDMNTIGPARRELLNRDKYYYKGVQMVDLLHASRGCRFNCYPCCVSYLGGRQFRPRPVDKVAEELATIKNNRLFMVDNSLAQNKQWEMDLFKEMIPFKKKWCSHPIEDDDQVLDLAVQAGAWYVYQAVFDTSDYIRNRVKRYHDYGIQVEGTIMLGTDDQTEDDIKRLIDFLLEIELDLAEFTIMTPFPHTKTFDDLVRENRIIDTNWNNYNAGKVVYQPKHMSPQRMQEMFRYAWDTFYKDESQSEKMGRLFQSVVMREMADGTYVRPRKDLANVSFGKEISRKVNS